MKQSSIKCEGGMKDSRGATTEAGVVVLASHDRWLLAAASRGVEKKNFEAPSQQAARDQPPEPDNACCACARNDSSICWCATYSGRWAPISRS